MNFYADYNLERNRDEHQDFFLFSLIIIVYFDILTKDILINNAAISLNDEHS